VGAVVLRFLVSAFFGVMVAVFIFVVLMRRPWRLSRVVLGVLAALPIVWGVVGIFFFEEATSIFRGE